jgi:hypothetical protein
MALLPVQSCPMFPLLIVYIRGRKPASAARGGALRSGGEVQAAGMHVWEKPPTKGFRRCRSLIHKFTHMSAIVLADHGRAFCTGHSVGPGKRGRSFETFRSYR